MTPQHCATFRVHLPVAERKNDCLETKAFRLMYRQDPNRILRVGRSNFRLTSGFFPPLQKTVDIGRFTLPVLGRQIKKCLYKDLFVLRKIGFEKTVKSLDCFIKRTM